jgi:hypothetical protein
MTQTTVMTQNCIPVPSCAVLRQRKDKRGVNLISDALPFGTTDNVSGRYRSVNKFDAAKPRHARRFLGKLAGIDIAHFFVKWRWSPWATDRCAQS